MATGTRIALWAAVVLSSLSSPAIFAQQTTSPQSSPIEQIVVTATRRSTNLADVPISVAAYSQETMDKQGVRSVEDIARLTPGVTFSHTAGGNTQSTTISIRGISSGAGTATVGVYIDETPVQIRPDSLTSTNPYPQIFDLQRVEILRGPQGTLFGAGSEGGTVRFITPEPGLKDYSGYARVETAFTKEGSPSQGFGAAFGGPIVEDTLGFRVSGYYRRNGGYVDRIDWNTGDVIQADSNFDDIRSFRGELKWQASDRLTFSPSVYYQETRINDSSVYWEGYSDPDDSQFINANPVRTPTNDKFVLTALETHYDFGDISLISNTSYLDRTNDNVFDASTLDLATFTGQGFLTPPKELSHFKSHANLQDTQKLLTQEVRLQSNDSDARVSWIAGLFYQHTKQHAEYFVLSPFLDDVLEYIDAPFRLTPLYYRGTYLLYSVSDLTNEEIAGFGSTDIKLGDRLTLTLGVRVSRNNYVSRDFGAGPVLGGESTSTVDSTETPVTPKIGLSFKKDDNNMFYLSVAKGYRQGSATGPISSACTEDAQALGISLGPREILPDYVWSYEIGSKNRLANGRLSLDSSIYQIDWSQIQSGLFLPNCNVPITANFGDATSRGFDIAANFAATDNLVLGMTVGYSDAEYTDNTKGANDAIIRPAGTPLPIAPWTVTFSSEYDFRMLDNEAYFRADFQYRSHNDTPPIPPGYTAADLPAIDPTIPRPPQSRNLDLRLGIRMDNGLDVSVFANNALNDHPAYSRFRDTMTTFNYRDVTVRPLTLGITGTFRY